MIGSFLLCFSVYFANINRLIYSDSVLNNTLVNFLIIFCLINLLYPHAKCYFTPIFSLAAIIYHEEDIKFGFMCMFSQQVGALFAASMVVNFLSPAKIIELENLDFILGYPQLQKDYSSFHGFLLEALFCSLMVWVFLQYGCP